MKEKVTTKALWNNAGKYGLILGAATAACKYASQMVSGIGSPFATVALGFIIWVIQFVGCIWLMMFFMKKLVEKYDGVDNSVTLKYGIMLALCSSIICASFEFINLSFLSTDFARQQMDAIYQLYGSLLDSNSRTMLQRIEENYANIAFFSNLIYCFIYGTILSAILSSRIPRKDPFAAYRAQDSGESGN